MRQKAGDLSRLKVAFLFLLVSVIAFGFLNSPGTGDVGIQMEWNQTVETKGIIEGFRANNDSVYPPYPPLNAVMFYYLGRLSRLSGVDAATGFKISCFSFLILSTAIFFLWTRNGILAVIFELSLVLSSTAHGYTDIHLTPTLLLSLWALQEKRWVSFTLLFAVSCLIKWQPLIIAPVLLIHVLDIQRWRDWRNVDFKGIGLRIVLPAVSVFLLVLSIFGTAVITSLDKAMHHNWFSANALNFNWIITYILKVFRPWHFGELSDGLIKWIRTGDMRIVLGAKILFISSYLMASWLFFRRPKTFSNLLLFSLLGYLSYFMFNTGVHENHLYFAVLFSALLVAQDRGFLPDFVFWSIAANANLYFFYGTGGLGVPFNRVAFIDITILLAFLNLFYYFMLFIKTWKLPFEQTAEPL
jgi:hypothetical protein